MKKFLISVFLSIIYTFSLYAVSLSPVFVSGIAKSSNSPLFKAILERDSNTVKKLISAGTDVNEKGEYNITPLMLAVEKKYYDIVDELLKNGANVNITANFGESDINNAFLFAVNKNDIKMIQLLADAGGNIDIRHEDGTTPLLYATMLEAANGSYYSMIKKLIELGADVNMQDKDGTSPILWIMHSSTYESKEILKMLLDAGADVNVKDVTAKTMKYGSGFNFDKEGTPLHIASGHQDIETIDMLVSYGAQINSKDIKNRNAILYAIGAPRYVDTNKIDKMIATVNNLLSLKININDKDIFGRAALHYACFEGQTYTYSGTTKIAIPNNPLIKILLDSGADINAQDNDGKTALMLAAQEDKEDNVKYLIEHGADIHIKDKNGKTALDLAREKEAVDVFWALKPYYK